MANYTTISDKVYLKFAKRRKAEDEAKVAAAGPALEPTPETLGPGVETKAEAETKPKSEPESEPKFGSKFESDSGPESDVAIKAGSPMAH